MADLFMTIDGKEVKVVPESDLLAVKGGLQSKVDQLIADHAKQMEDARKLADDNYQNLLKERGSHEELIKKFKELEPLPTKLQELQTLHETTTKKLTDTETAHTDLKRNYLKELYALPDDKLTGKSLEDLSLLETGLKAAGIKPRQGGGYDMGTGGGAGAQKTGVEICADELAATKKAMGIAN